MVLSGKKLKTELERKVIGPCFRVSVGFDIPAPATSVCNFLSVGAIVSKHTDSNAKQWSCQGVELPLPRWLIVVSQQHSTKTQAPARQSKCP